MRLQQETQFLQQVDFTVQLSIFEDDTVIVEFGNNKNCRIPMQKAAIADLEKAEDSAK